MNNTKNNVGIKINPEKIPNDVVKELAITFLEGARKFYANPVNVKKLKNGKKKGLKNSLIKIEFILCMWYKINMKNTEEIQNYYKNLNLLNKRGWNIP